MSDAILCFVWETAFKVMVSSFLTVMMALVCCFLVRMSMASTGCFLIVNLSSECTYLVNDNLESLVFVVSSCFFLCYPPVFCLSGFSLPGYSRLE